MAGIEEIPEVEVIYTMTNSIRILDANGLAGFTGSRISVCDGKKRCYNGVLGSQYGIPIVVSNGRGERENPPEFLARILPKDRLTIYRTGRTETSHETFYFMEKPEGEQSPNPSS